MRVRQDLAWLAAIIAIIALVFALTRPSPEAPPPPIASTPTPVAQPSPSPAVVAAPSPTVERRQTGPRVTYATPPSQAPARKVDWSRRVGIENVYTGMTRKEVQSAAGSPSNSGRGDVWLYYDGERVLNSVFFRWEDVAVALHGSGLYQDGRPLVQRFDSSETVEQVLGRPDEITGPERGQQWVYRRGDIVRVEIGVSYKHPVPVMQRVLIETQRQYDSYHPRQ